MPNNILLSKNHIVLFKLNLKITKDQVKNLIVYNLKNEKKLLFFYR